jgi:hypothetical protein
MEIKSPVHVNCAKDLNIKIPLSISTAGTSDHEVNAQICGWNCGFESHWPHGYVPLVNAVCCHLRLFATGRSLAQKSPTEYVCVRVPMFVCP